MIKIIFPLFLVLLAGGIFFFFANPLITGPASVNPQTGEVSGGVMAIRDQQRILNRSVGDAVALKGRIDTLERQLQGLRPEQISRLDNFLPDRMDEMQFIVDVNNIARRSNMAISEVNIRTIPTGNQRGGQATQATGEPQVRPMSMSFTVAGNYGQLKSFLNELANSLRIIDVDSLSFSIGEDGITRYNLNVTTYWIN